MIFSDDLEEKISGFHYQKYPLKELLQHIDASILPMMLGGRAKCFVNLLKGFTNKMSNEDFMLEFDHLLKEYHLMELEKKRKVIF